MGTVRLEAVDRLKQPEAGGDLPAALAPTGGWGIPQPVFLISVLLVLRLEPSMSAHCLHHDILNAMAVAQRMLDRRTLLRPRAERR
jgi:hypothetical protein